MNASIITFEREFWRKLIESGLPSRQLSGDRDALVRSIVECIAKWLAENPNIGPHAERVKQIALAFDQWQKATEKAGSVLRDQGIEDAAGRYQAENDAFIIFMRAAEGLRRWQRLYKPKDGGAEAYSSILLKRIGGLCCGADPEDRLHNEDRGAGMTDPELETLLQRMADSGRLPVLLLDIKSFMRGRRDTTTVRASAGQRTRSR
jgi:hypothetical protein